MTNTYQITEGFTKRTHTIPGVGLVHPKECIEWDGQLLFDVSDASFMTDMSIQELDKYVSRLSEYYQFGPSPKLFVSLDFIYTVRIYTGTAPSPEHFYRSIKASVQ